MPVGILVGGPQKGEVKDAHDIELQTFTRHPPELIAMHEYREPPRLQTRVERYFFVPFRSQNNYSHIEGMFVHQSLVDGGRRPNYEDLIFELATYYNPLNRRNND